MKMSVKLLAAALFFAGFATCASADITWTLNDVTFNNGDAVTGSSLLKLIAADAALPRPAHLDATGPISLQSPPSPRSRGTDKP